MSLGKEVFSKSYWLELPNSTHKTYEDIIPKNAAYAWIDNSNSYVMKDDYVDNGFTESYPVPHLDIYNSNNNVGIKLREKTKLMVYTATNWSGYKIFVTVKWVM